MSDDKLRQSDSRDRIRIMKLIAKMLSAYYTLKIVISKFIYYHNIIIDLIFIKLCAILSYYQLLLHIDSSV